MRRILPSLVLAAALLTASAAHASSPDIVVSQLYAGGGNTGASFTNDFVELFNRGSSTVDVSSWTIQYASATGTTWQTTALSGSIAPGRYYLVQLFSAGASGATPPAADAVGTPNLANSGGKIALVRDATALTCGASVGSCSGSSQIADLVGWGGAADHEGSSAAAALTNTTGVARAGGGCTDTDDNAADFSAVTPTPRNSSTTASPCQAEPPPPAQGVSQSATVDIDIEPALSIALERTTVSFGTASVGDTPAEVSERVTVLSNNSAGYALTVHRSAFQPADLPLGLRGTAPAGGQIGASLAGGAMAPVPISPAADLLVGTTSAASSTSGDVWPLSLGFTQPLPVVPPGRYAAVVTFTAIGR
jgi:hypothetical protein